VAIGWFALTVLRGHAERFAFGAMVSGFAVLALLNFVNPDALVVRANVARAEAGMELDAGYLASLSAMPADARCDVLQSLEGSWWWGEASGWRSWNVAGWRARRATEDLRAAPDPACPIPIDEAGPAS
jgi:hypothetical protein